MMLKGQIKLKNSDAKYLKRSLPWVYSNELSVIDKTIAPGSWVELLSSKNEVLGYGHFNPHSLMAYRTFEREPFRTEEMSRALFYKRLDIALQLRQSAYATEFANGTIGRRSFRLAFGESDGLPGLILDLYENAPSGVAVLQCHSAGADQFITWAQAWLHERLGIDCGFVRNDVEVRKKEAVKLEVLEWGSPPTQARVVEGGVEFLVDLKQGQKTGYFYDHRDNRARFAKLLQTLDGAPLVADFFSYVGSWGLQVLKQNPKAQLLAIDVSQNALDMVMENAKRNGVEKRVKVIKADVLEDKDLKQIANRSLDAVVSDPPSLSSSAKHLNNAKRAHTQCFKTALQKLKPGGFAALATCSFHMSWDDFLQSAEQASPEVTTFFDFGSQAADHPVLSNLPETRYLKSVFLRKNI